MIAATKLDLSNLLYVAGAVLAAAVISLGLYLHRRRPNTIEADMESFNRGLRALAPEGNRRVARPGPPGSSGSIPEARPAVGGQPPAHGAPPPPGGRHDETEARSG